MSSLRSFAPDQSYEWEEEEELPEIRIVLPEPAPLKETILSNNFPTWAFFKATTPTEAIRIINTLPLDTFDFKVAESLILNSVELLFRTSPSKAFKVTNYFIQQIELFLVKFPNNQESRDILSTLKIWLQSNFKLELVDQLSDVNLRVETMLGMSAILMAEMTPESRDDISPIKERLLKELLANGDDLRLNNQMTVLTNLSWQQIIFKGKWLDQLDTFELFNIFRSIYDKDPTNIPELISPRGGPDNYDQSREDLRLKFAINTVNFCGNLLLTGDFSPSEVQPMVEHAIATGGRNVINHIINQIIPETQEYNRLVPLMFVEFWRDVIGIEA